MPASPLPSRAATRSSAAVISLPEKTGLTVAATEWLALPARSGSRLIP